MSDRKGDCEPPFWEKLSILFDNFHLTYQATCPHSSINFVARIVFVALCTGLVLSPFMGVFIIFVSVLFGVLAGLIIIYFSPVPAPSKQKEDPSKDPREEMKKEQVGAAFVAPLAISEHFVNGGSTEGSVQPVESQVLGVEQVDAFPFSGQVLPDYTPPTSRNPFMNLLIDEYKYNPSRPAAAPVDDPTVKQTMDDYFRIQWYSDPTDVFGKNQGQRQFITQPSTTVPNDQGAFANWLYKIPGKTCKEGGRDACLSGTDGGTIPWLNHSS
jgi:hypothetical protein